MTTPRPLVVKCTSAAEAPERAGQAFTVAATAAASGSTVWLWLTGDAVWFAVPGKAEKFDLPHSAPLQDLRDTIKATGTFTVCTQCAARRNLTERDMVPGAAIRGSASFVAEILQPDVQALVY